MRSNTKAYVFATAAILIAGLSAVGIPVAIIYYLFTH